MKEKRFRWITIGVLAVICLYPFKTTVVPRHRIKIVDKDGHPVSKALARQGWGDYSAELNAGSSEDQWSDENGYVIFPERSVRANLLKRGLVLILNILQLNPHASYRQSAYVIAWDPDGKSGSIHYELNKPLPETIVIAP